MPDAPKTTQFSRVGAYNPPTTRKPVICQFRKNTRLISVLIVAIYEKVKIWHRIQWPVRISGQNLRFHSAV